MNWEKIDPKTEIYIKAVVLCAILLFVVGAIAIIGMEIYHTPTPSNISTESITAFIPILGFFAVLLTLVLGLQKYHA